MHNHVRSPLRCHAGALCRSSAQPHRLACRYSGPAAVGTRVHSIQRPRYRSAGETFERRYSDAGNSYALAFRLLAGLRPLIVEPVHSDRPGWSLAGTARPVEVVHEYLPLSRFYEKDLDPSFPKNGPAWNQESAASRLCFRTTGQNTAIDSAYGLLERIARGDIGSNLGTCHDSYQVDASSLGPSIHKTCQVTTLAWVVQQSWSLGHKQYDAVYVVRRLSSSIRETSGALRKPLTTVSQTSRFVTCPRRHAETLLLTRFAKGVHDDQTRRQIQRTLALKRLFACNENHVEATAQSTLQRVLKSTYNVVCES